MWSFRVGILALLAAFMLLLARRFGVSGGGIDLGIRAVGSVGLLAVLVGLLGLVLGGRHAPGD
jgi:hypothetical protein